MDAPPLFVSSGGAQALPVDFNRGVGGGEAPCLGFLITSPGRGCAETLSHSLFLPCSRCSRRPRVLGGGEEGLQPPLRPQKFLQVTPNPYRAGGRRARTPKPFRIRRAPICGVKRERPQLRAPDGGGGGGIFLLPPRAFRGEPSASSSPCFLQAREASGRARNSADWLLCYYPETTAGAERAYS